MTSKAPTFRELVNLSEWQQLQDHFAEVLRIRLRTVDLSGEAITIPSGPTTFCEQTVGQSVEGRKRCGACLPATIRDGALLLQEFESDHCHVLTKNFALPILVMEGLPIAYLLVGPIFIGKRVSVEQYGGMIKDLGIASGEFAAGIHGVRLFTHSGVRSVLQLLRSVAGHVVQREYHLLRLKRLVPWLTAMEGETAPKFVERTLQALLDIAMTASRAEASSIMVYSPSNGRLTVRLAKGLKRDVVLGATTTVNDSLSGLVVRRREPLVVSNVERDQAVDAKRRRPELTSSMLLPVTPVGQDTPFAVLSLGTTSAQTSYQPQDVTFMRQLVNLAEVALAGVNPEEE